MYRIRIRFSILYFYWKKNKQKNALESVSLQCISIEKKTSQRRKAKTCTSDSKAQLKKKKVYPSNSCLPVIKQPAHSLLNESWSIPERSKRQERTRNPSFSVQRNESGRLQAWSSRDVMFLTVVWLGNRPERLRLWMGWQLCRAAFIIFHENWKREEELIVLSWSVATKLPDLSSHL